MDMSRIVFKSILFQPLGISFRIFKILKWKKQTTNKYPFENSNPFKFSIIEDSQNFEESLNFHSNLLFSIARGRYYFEQIWNIVFCWDSKIDSLKISTVTFILARVLKGCIQTLKYFVTSNKRSFQGRNVPMLEELVPKYCMSTDASVNMETGQNCLKRGFYSRGEGRGDLGNEWYDALVRSAKKSLCFIL